MRSATATRSASRTSYFPWRPFLFFLGRWEVEAPGASSLRFPFASLSRKMASTASSPEAKLVAMSRSVAAEVGTFRPNSRTRSRQEVPERKAWTTSESPTLGNSVHCLENRRMKSQRDSFGFWRQLLRSQEFPGRTYVPWKFPTKTFTKSRQSWIYEGGRCSSQPCTESDRNKGRLQMMSRSSFTPPS